ncbi:MAG: hypothetical protein LBK69_05815 [Syntrophomonadaceae bacterium]|jgi:hypothetical protein|nr:hypothetical protein [Syntrophomonadaceae bacterium]
MKRTILYASYIEQVQKNIQKWIDDGNEVWFSTLKLIITLSATILFGSITFIDKLGIMCIEKAQNLAVISWLFLIAAIILAVLNLALSADEMHQSWARAIKNLPKIKKELDAGKQSGQLEMGNLYLPIANGILALIFFLGGTFNLSICLILRIKDFSTWIIVVANIILFIYLAILIYIHIKSRLKEDHLEPK